jgi:AcrR family transcriptional regulator
MYNHRRADVKLPNAGKPTMRRTAEEAAETKRTILRAARRLFAERGYAATSTRDLMTETGVTRGALYHHFVDKADLFRAVFVDIEHELDETVNEAARAAAGDGARAAIVAGGRAWISFARRDDYRRIALVDAPAVVGQEAWHEIDRNVGLRSMEGGLRSLARSGALAIEPTRALAVGLFGALTEIGLSVARGDLDEDDGVAAFEALLDGLAPRVRAARRRAPT